MAVPTNGTAAPPTPKGKSWVTNNLETYEFAMDEDDVRPCSQLAHI